jgi:thioredoxin-dependent peroxiredoxin
VEGFSHAVKDSEAVVTFCCIKLKFDDCRPTGSLACVLSPGQKIDVGFRLKVVRDGVVKEVMFGELLTRPTIISVYMRNNTPACDRQTSSLAEHAAEFDRAGFNLVAVSRDTCGSHARYARAKGIRFTLASDPEDHFAHATDSLITKSMYGRNFVGPARAAYVIDCDGTILAVVPKVDRDDHAAQLKELIKSL